MHNDYSRPPNSWNSRSVPGPRDFAIWDTAQFKAVDGDNGGTWNPLTPIVIGGSGVTLTNAFSNLKGGFLTQQGGRYSLGANDFPTFSLARMRTVICPLWQASPFNEADGVAFNFQVLSSPAFGIQSSRASGAIYIPIPARFLHNGATLAGAKLRFRMLKSVLGTSSTLSTTVPIFFGVAGLSSAGAFQSESTTPTDFYASTWQASHAYALNSWVGSLATSNGFIFQATSISGTGTSGGSEPVWPTVIGNTVTDNPGANQIVWTNKGFSGRLVTPASVNALYAGGQPQIIQFSPFSTTGTGLVIDTTTYAYHVVISGNYSPFGLFHSAELDYSVVNDLRFP